MEKIQALSATLKQFPKDFHVHQRINEFYYMQKMTEFTVLDEKLTHLVREVNALRQHLEGVYEETFRHWRSDVRWMATHQRLVEKVETKKKM